jgi:hypothetical protein
LSKEERSNGGKWQFDLEFVECWAECGLEGWANKGFETLPREDNLAAFQGLFSLRRR